MSTELKTIQLESAERTQVFEPMRNEPHLGLAVRRVSDRLDGGFTPAVEAYLQEGIEDYQTARKRERWIAKSEMVFDPKPLYTPESLNNLRNLREHTSDASIIWVLRPGITLDKITAGYMKVAGPNGKELLNWLSAASSLNLGGQHPDIETADAWAGRKYGSNNCSAYHPMGIEDESKKLLAEVTPGTHQKFVVWESTGGGANTVAMEAAFFHQQEAGRTSRDLIVRFDNAYHGNNGLAGAATDFGIAEKYKHILGRIPTASLPFPHDDQSTALFMDMYESLVGQDRVAGILLEAIQGDGGMRTMTQEAADFITSTNEDRDILSIWDEVQSGMGRSGKFLGIEWLGESVANSPQNAVTMAKALANGYPISAAILPRSYDQFPPVGALTTMMGNASGLVRMMTAIEIINQPSFLDAVRLKGEMVKNMLNQAASPYGHLRGARGHGFMLGAEFTRPDGTSAVTDAICYLGGCGILTGGVENNGLRLHPSLTTEPEVVAAVAGKVIMAGELMDENVLPKEVYQMVQAGKSGLDR